MRSLALCLFANEKYELTAVSSSFSLICLAAVFVPGLVEHVVTAILDGPVTAVDAQQLGGAGLGGGAAGHAQGHFNALTA